MSEELFGALTEQLLDRLATLVAERVVQKLRAVNDDMIGQEQSPLGRRRHCAAVRCRVAAGLPGAAIVGRRHLLTQEALQEELSGQGPRKALAPENTTPSIADELSAAIAQELGSQSYPSIDKSIGSARR